MDNNAVQIQIDNLKEDVTELKEFKNIFMENTNKMSENIVKLTVLAEKQDERMAKQEEYQRLQSNQIEALKEDFTKHLYTSKSVDKNASIQKDAVHIPKDVIKIMIALIVIIGGILGIPLINF